MAITKKQLSDYIRDIKFGGDPTLSGKIHPTMIWKTADIVIGKMIEAEGEMRGGEAGAKWQKQWALNKVKDAYNGMMDNNIALEDLQKEPDKNKAQIRELERDEEESSESSDEDNNVKTLIFPKKRSNKYVKKQK